METIEVVGALVAVIAALFALYRADPRSRLRLRSDLELLRLHRELEIDAPEIERAIDDRRAKLYPPPKPPDPEDLWVGLLFRGLFVYLFASLAYDTFVAGLGWLFAVLSLFGLSIAESFVTRIKEIWAFYHRKND